MGPRDWFETIKEVVKKIGGTEDTGGSQTAGTVFAKENAILEMLKNGGMPVVKSVQTIRPNKTNIYTENDDGTGSLYHDYIISKVNPQKTVVFANSAAVSGTATSFFPLARLIDDSTVRIYASYAKGQASPAAIFGSYVQVVEFF